MVIEAGLSTFDRLDAPSLQPFFDSSVSSASSVLPLAQNAQFFGVRAKGITSRMFCMPVA